MCGKSHPGGRIDALLPFRVAQLPLTPGTSLLSRVVALWIVYGLSVSCADAVQRRHFAQVYWRWVMQRTRSAITALGIALALVAMPASAGWRSFDPPAPSGGTESPGGPLGDSSLLGDDPIDIPDELTQVDNDFPPPDLGNETLPSSLPSCPVFSRTR